MKRKCLFLLLVLILPVFVYADTCDNSKIVISNVEKIESSGYVEEINSPVINGQSVSTNLKLYDVGDSITYSFKVKNNSTDDYDLRKNISSDENVTYEIISNNNTIKSGEEKTIQLKVTYKNKVDESKYINGKYVQNKEHNITLGDSIINPYTSTGISRMILLCIVMFILIVVSFVFVKGNKKYLSLLVLLLLPILVRASCLYRINIISNIEFKKVIPNPCTFDGDLVQGAEYVNGQYTYRYKLEKYGVELFSLTNGTSSLMFDYGYMLGDGWSVDLTDSDSIEPINSKLCTSINGKPVVSMNYLFANSKASSIDLSSFDTSNVNNMSGMFYNTSNVVLDFSSFDTSNVKSMSGMFEKSKVDNLDLSNFDTSEVVNMIGMFSNNEASTINLSNFNTSKVTMMNNMFYNSKALVLDLSSFDTSSVLEMSSMFSGSLATNINVSSFDTSNVTNMNSMFANSKALSLDLSSFDMHKVTSAQYMFCNVNQDIITKGANYVELGKMYECYKVDPCAQGGCAA